MRKQLLHKLSRAAGKVPNTQTSQDAIDKAARDYKTVFGDRSIFSETHAVLTVIYRQCHIF